MHLVAKRPNLVARFHRASRLLVLGVAAAACGCAPSSSGSGDGDGGSGTVDGGSGGDGGTRVGHVYASTQGALYELEPFSRVMRHIGDFDCIELTPDPADSQDGMADIAVDKDGRMYGIGRVGPGDIWSLVSIDVATASCTEIAVVAVTDLFPCGLTFVPAGTLDPTNETLVGVSVDGSYFRFDLATGARIDVGSAGKTFRSKGADLVSVIDAKTYTTSSGEGGATDALLELDPRTGQVVRTIGSTGVHLIAGLGFWAGTLYAFNYEGQLFAVDPDTGAATEITIPNRPEGLRFWGAAVTTAAPPVPID